jgi:hypothetical protein
MNRIGDTLFHYGSNKEIILEFNKNDVEFLLIGGLAISWYCPTRVVDDMDILVNPTKLNSKKIFNSLLNINCRLDDEMSFAAEGVQLPLKNHYYVDIITPPKNGFAFSEVYQDSLNINFFDVPVKIPSISSLIKLAGFHFHSEPANIKRERDINLLLDAESNLKLSL